MGDALKNFSGLPWQICITCPPQRSFRDHVCAVLCQFYVRKPVQSDSRRATGAKGMVTETTRPWRQRNSNVQQSPAAFINTAESGMHCRLSKPQLQVMARPGIHHWKPAQQEGKQQLASPDSACGNTVSAGGAVAGISQLTASSSDVLRRCHQRSW
jgi:hypothetical protein